MEDQKKLKGYLEERSKNLERICCQILDPLAQKLRHPKKFDDNLVEILKIPPRIYIIFFI